MNLSIPEARNRPGRSRAVPHAREVRFVDPLTGSALLGVGTQLLGGLFGGGSARREASRNREHEAEMMRQQTQAQRDTAGRRGWGVVDPLLERAAGYAEDAYQQRVGQGPYRQNVSAPRRGPGASSGSRAIAGRAQELALGGPGQTTQAGMDYVQRTLGGQAPEGSSASYYQGGGDAYAALPRGRGARMFQDAYGQARGGENEYIGQLFGAAQGLLPGGGSAGGTTGGGAGGISGSAGLNPSAYNINADDPRFAIDPSQYNIDPTGGALGAPGEWDTRGWVGSMYDANAPVGAAGDIRALLDDPFAKSNPFLEDIVRMQGEDLQRAHSAELGRLNETAGNLGAYGGSDFQLARSQMAGELGRNVERAGTGLRYENFQNRMNDFMTAMQMGSQMDQQAAGQALQAEIFNRSDITDREKSNLAAQVQRELANQGTQAGLASGNLGAQLDIALGNQGTQAGLAQTGASLGTQRDIANQSAALTRESLTARQNADYLQAMLGAAGLQNESQLSRLGLMGDFAGGMGGLETTGAAGQLDAGAGLGALEQGALGAIPGLEQIEMGRLGQAGALVGGVDRQNAASANAYNQARSRYDQSALQWDYNRRSQAVDDLIRQGLNIGGHIVQPAGTPTTPYAQQTTSAPPQQRSFTMGDPRMFA